MSVLTDLSVDVISYRLHRAVSTDQQSGIPLVVTIFIRPDRYSQRNSIGADPVNYSRFSTTVTASTVSMVYRDIVVKEMI